MFETELDRQLPLEPGAGRSSHAMNNLGWRVVFLEQEST
jgi:hypothetical protein